MGRNLTFKAQMYLYIYIRAKTYLVRTKIETTVSTAIIVHCVCNVQDKELLLAQMLRSLKHWISVTSKYYMISVTHQHSKAITELCTRVQWCSRVQSERNSVHVLYTSL